VRVTCEAAPASCAGTVALRTLPVPRHRQVVMRPRRFRVAAGASRTIALRADLRRLRRAAGRRARTVPLGPQVTIADPSLKRTFIADSSVDQRLPRR
jgi:hypothetical protein